MAQPYLNRTVSESEYRLRLLYAAEKLGLCRKEELWSFLAELDLMDYLPFCQLLSELTAGGEIGVLPAGTLFVTERGRSSLGLFEERIPSSLRGSITRSLTAFRKRLEERKQVSSGYEGCEMTDFSCMYGRYYEEERPIFLMRLFTGNGALCEKAVHRFAEKLPLLLPLLYHLPVEAEDACAKSEEAYRLCAEGKPLLAPLGREDYGAAVCLTDGQTEYRLQLLFHGYTLASGWAWAVDAAGASIVRRLNALWEEKLP